MYKVATLKKRIGFVARLNLGEADCEVSLASEKELLDLLTLTTNVTVCLTSPFFRNFSSEWIGGLAKFKEVKVIGLSRATQIKRLWRLPNLEVSVRAELAYNRNTPKEVLEVLASDSSVWVRRGVAFNTNTPSSLLEKLALDVEEWIRKGVAVNKNTPSTVLEELVSDPEESVRRRAASNLSNRKESEDV